MAELGPSASMSWWEKLNLTSPAPALSLVVVQATHARLKLTRSRRKPQNRDLSGSHELCMTDFYGAASDEGTRFAERQKIITKFDQNVRYVPLE
ncbi:hypothetical protein [Methylobacterium sp. D48H]